MLRNSILFTPVQLGARTIANRFMRSATWEKRADATTGHPTPELLSMITDLSVGETGLIVPGFVYPIFHAKAYPNQTSVEHWGRIAPWAATIDAIHKRGSTIIFQVCHGGSITDLTGPELEETILAFGAAAYKLRLAGADGVQIHAAHGFLYSRSLSPFANIRRDRWGGDFDNRLRLLAETAALIRAMCGRDFIVGVKLNASDCVDGGVTPDMCGRYLAAVEHILDFAEISCGVPPKTWASRCRILPELYRQKLPSVADIVEQRAIAGSGGVPYVEGYNLAFAKTIREMLPQLKLAVVGGLRKVEMMEAAVNSGVADLVAMSRPFIKQPHLVRDIRLGKISQVACNSCGMCTYYRDKGIHCYNW
jgi:2,4-dienoyl-CoA reductase-like NADH-dependent reductase (Old Yellow Enzyme family)